MPRTFHTTTPPFNPDSAGRESNRSVPRPAGFTLLELLIVMAVIAILASISLTGISRAKQRAAALRCLSNMRQLQLAWLVYAHENSDQLPPNGMPLSSPSATKHYWWAQGILDYEPDNPQNTNTALLLDPAFALLGPYAKSAQWSTCGRSGPGSPAKRPSPAHDVDCPVCPAFAAGL